MSQAEDDLVSAIKAYLTETKSNCLDLKGQNYSLKVFESILKILPDLEVTELNLEGNDWSKGIESLRKFLKQTKIKTLKLGNFTVLDSELVALLDVLKDSEIVDLGSFVFDVNINEVVDGRFLVSELLQSRLTKLKIWFHFCSAVTPKLFVEGLPTSSLTSLRFKTTGSIPKVLISLFRKLPLCQIKDLDLSYNRIDDDLIKAVHVYLKPSKIEKLNLGHNDISDAGLNALGQGLVGSNVIDLNLKRNNFSGLNNFGSFLKNTNIRFLDLSENCIKHRQMFAFPDFLKGSFVESLDVHSCVRGDEVMVELLRSLKSTQVSKLNIANNFLSALSMSEFAAVLKDTNLEDVTLTGNKYPLEAFNTNFFSSSFLDQLFRTRPSETFGILSECFKDSKLKYIQLDGPHPADTTSFLRFLEGTKNSLLLSIKMKSIELSRDCTELFAKTLMNTTFTYLKISYSEFNDTFPTFIVNLKYTSITHLNLSWQKIFDEDVLILAATLKETKIINLDLSDNHIRSSGARTLAKYCPQTSLISLNLDRNIIETDGLECLAECLASSFITKLSVIGNPSKCDEDLESIMQSSSISPTICGDPKLPPEKYEAFLPIEKVLWENRLHAHNLVVSFKKLFPKITNGTFNFHEYLHDWNVNDFLEEYLEFYKKLVDLPAGASILWCEESLSFSRKELVPFLFDIFPRQLIEFIANWVEADVSNLVEFLERAEKLGLVKIVEYLLLLRPRFLIDENEGILHPYVYTLLLKHEQPLCSLTLEPQGIVKISDYFAKHSDLEGATDLIKLLSEVKLT